MSSFVITSRPGALPSGALVVTLSQWHGAMYVSWVIYRYVVVWWSTQTNMPFCGPQASAWT